MYVWLLPSYTYYFQRLSFFNIAVFGFTGNRVLIYEAVCSFFLISLSLLSCSKEDPLQTLDLPSDSAMHDANRFALIIETYVSLLDKPGDDGITVSHARKFDVFPVEGLEIVKEDGEQILWVNLGKGWIQRSSVQLYSSKEKVLTAAKKLK